MPDEKNACACNGGVTLIFPCSGAADVGEISDRAARVMAARGQGKMFCLAGIGGNISGMIASARGADQVLVIDGCGVDCAKKTMEERGIDDYIHLRVTDLGMEKSKSPATQERIDSVAQKGKELLSN
ncbi:MAG: zinc-binding protein [Candidatus Aminicenantes bacterium]|nr:zinc-binding protein [Candidatus Aminicenantes bacterium]NIM79743.1 zinc-binding protein [Candidatus Aminicenantes bacterium]NIN19074.1 zinc-binding protein [Candidatus Aminicenantes bacterium]NIN42976.1 zinc-binding protein [Candidatus Aminicenantes bacterium]NIN85719.1 zinc-binding protein [Candidatus Aminicenantes bacterium]